ncbi:hypothetical protein Vretimale_17297 [Volvox reticuliferus]|uniref:Mitochondrial carrier protein n=1 Tax=Volvox reticuliferus TaxID=1737510 RepID=A0A8J4GVE1_9CHLO|nr:hypothetical protein Vretimale_17297 [Volvox reticuliferus]
MQQAGSAARYPGGPLQCLREIVVTEGGLRGLTRGLGATMAREVPGNALFFAVYEALRRSLLGAQRQQQQQTARGLGHGVGEPLTPGPVSGLTDLVAQADAPPYGRDAATGGRRATSDTETSRPGSPEQHGADATRHNWLTEAAIAVFCGGTAGTLLWREGGLASLYAGLTPTLVRAFPANACQWLAWEVVMRGLQDHSERAK